MLRCRLETSHALLGECRPDPDRQLNDGEEETLASKPAGDPSMVRAGVASHLMSGEGSGYREITEPRQRYSLIDHHVAWTCLTSPPWSCCKRSHKEWVEETLRIGEVPETVMVREHRGGKQRAYAMVKKQRGIRAKGWMIAEVACEYQLRETQSPYSTNFGVQNGLLSSNSLHSGTFILLNQYIRSRETLPPYADSSLRRADKKRFDRLGGVSVLSR